MRSAFDCALDLQKELESDGLQASGWRAHECDVEITKEGFSIIQRHIERIIREAQAGDQKKVAA